MNRRSLILILAILLFVGAVFGAYYLIVRRPSQETKTLVAEKSPRAPEAKLLVPEAVVSPVLSFDGETVWFMSEQGRLYRQAVAAGSTKEEYLLPARVDNPQRVIWQQMGSNFIVKQAVAGHTRYEFYDAENKTFVPYEPAVREPAFLPDDREIVYIWVADGGHGELTRGAPDGKNYKKLSDLYRPDYKMVVSPAKNEVLLFADDADNPDNLLLVDLDTVKYTLLDEKAAYSEAKFSPDGRKAVVKKAGKLVVYDLTNLNNTPHPPLTVRGGEGELSLNQLAWSSDSRQIYVVDNGHIRAYDVVSRQWSEVYRFAADSRLAPREMLLHPSRPILFFTDSSSGYLYRLDLE